MAALHPFFKQYYNWSWLVGDLFYQQWLSLGAEDRAALCVTAPIPPRLEWVEDFFKDKIVQALPAKQQVEYRGEHRAGKRIAVHSLLCQLFQVYQPGGMHEKQDVNAKLNAPKRLLRGWCNPQRDEELAGNHETSR